MMYPLFQRFDRSRWRNLVLALAAGLLVLSVPSRFTAPYRVVFASSLSPLRRAAFQGGGYASALLGSVISGVHAEDRNRALERRVLELESELQQITSRLDESEVRRLSLEKLVRTLPDLTVVQASVIGYDASGLRRSIQLDVGRKHGVVSFLPACFAGVLVGLTGQCSWIESRVILLTDSACKVPAKIVRAGQPDIPCVTRGNSSDEVELLWVKRDSGVTVGDQVVTSHIRLTERLARPPFPAGIPIGTVVECRPSETSPMLMHVRVRPLANLDRLETAEVLLPE